MVVPATVAEMESCRVSFQAGLINVRIKKCHYATFLWKIILVGLSDCFFDLRFDVGASEDFGQHRLFWLWLSRRCWKTLFANFGRLRITSNEDVRDPVIFYFRGALHTVFRLDHDWTASFTGQVS